MELLYGQSQKLSQLELIENIRVKSKEMHTQSCTADITSIFKDFSVSFCSLLPVLGQTKYFCFHLNVKHTLYRKKS